MTAEIPADTGNALRRALQHQQGGHPTEVRAGFWRAQMEGLQREHRDGASGLVIARAIADVVDAISPVAG